jgi:N4-gp56 family major capsid protein
MEFSYAKYAVEKTLPRNFGDTINWRRFNKLETTKNPLTEGVTPGGQTITGSEVTAVIAQYGNVMYFTDIIDLQQLDRVRQEYTVELGFQAKETMDEIVRDTLVAEGSAYFAGGASAVSELTTLLTHRVKIDDFRKIVLGMKRGFIAGNRKAAGRYVALVAPEIMFSLFEDQKVRDYMDFGQTNGMFNDGMIVDMFGIRFEEVLNAPMTVNGEVVAHDSIVIGEESYAITKLEGQSLKVITKGLGSAGVEDPLDQRQSIGWKMTGFASKVLNPEAVVNYWALAVDANDAEVEAPNFNYATTIIGPSGGGSTGPTGPTKTVLLEGFEYVHVNEYTSYSGYSYARATYYNWVNDGSVVAYSFGDKEAPQTISLTVPENATIADILSDKEFLVYGTFGAGALDNNTSIDDLDGSPVVAVIEGLGYITPGGLFSARTLATNFEFNSFNQGPGFAAQYGKFGTVAAGYRLLSELTFENNMRGFNPSGYVDSTGYDFNRDEFADYLYGYRNQFTYYGGSETAYDGGIGFDETALDTYPFASSNNTISVRSQQTLTEWGGMESGPFEAWSAGVDVDDSYGATANFQPDTLGFYHDLKEIQGYLEIDPRTTTANAPDIAVIVGENPYASLINNHLAADGFESAHSDGPGWAPFREKITWTLADINNNALDYVVPDGARVVLAPAAFFANDFTLTKLKTSNGSFPGRYAIRVGDTGWFGYGYNGYPVVYNG